MTGSREKIVPKFLSEKERQYQDLKIIAVQAPVYHEGENALKNNDPYQKDATTSYYSSFNTSSYHSGSRDQQELQGGGGCTVYSSKSDEISFPGDMTAATDDMTYQAYLRPIEYDSQDNYRYSTIFRESYMDGFNITSPGHNCSTPNRGTIEQNIRSPPITPPTIRSSHLTRQQGMIRASNSLLDFEHDERQQNQHCEQIRSKVNFYQAEKQEHKSHLLNGLKWKMKTSSLPLTIDNNRKKRKNFSTFNLAKRTQQLHYSSSKICPVNISTTTLDDFTDIKGQQERKQNLGKIYKQMESSIKTGGPTLEDMAAKIYMGERDYSEELEKFDFRRLLDSSKPSKSFSPSRTRGKSPMRSPCLTAVS